MKTKKKFKVGECYQVTKDFNQCPTITSIIEITKELTKEEIRNGHYPDDLFKKVYEYKILIGTQYDNNDYTFCIDTNFSNCLKLLESNNENHLNKELIDIINQSSKISGL